MYCGQGILNLQFSILNLQFSIFNLQSSIFICLLLFCGCTDSELRRSQLHDLQVRNEAGALMTDDSLAAVLCTWADGHGTPADRLLAHYLMGRTWADKGEAPLALEEYHTAASLADTTDTHCDYRLLTRIHAQTANLFYEQQMPNEMLEELELMRLAANKADDTLSLISSIEWKSVAYDYLGDRTNVKAYILQAFNAYNSQGLTDMAVNCIPMLADVLTMEQDFQEARKYMDFYEHHAAAGQNGMIRQGKEFYYNFKGNYYLGINKPDSAEYFYRMLARLCTDDNDREAAYKGLYELFMLKGKPDSAAKYADLCYKTSERRFRESASEQLRHMQSLYNYNRSLKLAHAKSEEALKQHYLFLACLTLFAFAVVLSAVAFWRYKRKKREELAGIIQGYQLQMEQQEQAKRELLQLKEHETALLIAQKEQEIALRQELIDQYRQTISQDKPLDSMVVGTAEYERFHYLATHPCEKPTKKDWSQLQRMMNRCLPMFYKKVNMQKHLKESDYHICMLLRLHFTYSEISTLTDFSLQYIYSRRLQLLKTVFGIKGKAEEFDKLLLHIK